MLPLILAERPPTGVTEEEPQEDDNHAKFFLLPHVRVSLLVV